MKIVLYFGAMCDPIHKQLGLSKRLTKHAQLDADAVVRLAIRGVITDSEGRRVRQRIINRLAKELDVLPPSKPKMPA